MGTEAHRETERFTRMGRRAWGAAQPTSGYPSGPGAEDLTRVESAWRTPHGKKKHSDLLHKHPFSTGFILFFHPWTWCYNNSKMYMTITMIHEHEASLFSMV
jgi:hypothetical protein